MKFKIFSLLLILSIFAYSQTPKNLFYTGIDLIAEKNTEDGRDSLKKFVEEFPDDENIYTALVTLVKTTPRSKFEEKVAYAEKLS